MTTKTIETVPPSHSAGGRGVPVKPSTGRGWSRLTRWLVLAVGCAVAVLILAPLLLMVLNAFKSPSDYSNHGALTLPSRISLGGARRFITETDYPRKLLNSVVISGVTAVLGLLIALLSSYAIGVGRIRGRTSMVVLLLVATMLPQEALIYPLFHAAQALGLRDSIWSVVIIFTVLHATFATYLLSSVMEGFPKELLEAARIDGAGRWKILWRVVTPVMRSTLAVLLVFLFIWTWNEFLIPLVMLTNPDTQTVPIALANLKGEHQIDATEINAASLLSMLPTFVFFLFFQRTLTRGITAGSVK